MASKPVNGVIPKRIVPDWETRCRCGHLIRRIDKEAGEKVPCPICHTEHEVTEPKPTRNRR